MNGTMDIARSSEEGMYLLREGECLWRINQDGEVDCTAQGKASAFALLSFVREWKREEGYSTL